MHSSSTRDQLLADWGSATRRETGNNFIYGGAPLLEFHDQGWFPEKLREYVTDCLQFVFNSARVYQPIVPRLRRAIRATESATVVDLCSGGGGPWPWLHRALQNASTVPIKICMTDKFPNIPAYEKLQGSSQGQITFEAETVDATRLPETLRGFRTIFTSFHHFPPDAGLAILRDAVEAREGIGVFEAARRKPLAILSTVFMLVGGFLAAPLIQPFRLSRFLWTFIIPIIPLVLFFDGIVSCLRAYSKEELAAMISRLHADDYVWEIGEEPGWFARVTYLLGYPRV